MQCGEVLLRVECAHTAGPCCGDRLAIDVVLHVADGEDSGNVRLRRVRLRDQVAGLVVLELVEEDCRVRIVADRREHAVRVEVPGFVGVDVTQAHARDPLVSEHLLNHSVGDPVDPVVGPRPIFHDLRGPELLAPVHDRHLGGEAGEEGRLLHGGIAATDDDHVLVREEGSVTGRAV